MCNATPVAHIDDKHDELEDVGLNLKVEECIMKAGEVFIVETVKGNPELMNEDCFEMPGKTEDVDME